MRRTIILLALAVSAALLAACGSSTQPAPRTHAAAVAPTGARTSGPLTNPQAVAFARAVNLRAADVPGFTVSSEHETNTPREKRLERAMLRCAGSVGLRKGLAEVSSKAFELKRNILDLGVSSEVNVAHTSALAAEELAAIRSAHVRDCFSRYLDLLLEGQKFAGAAVGPVSIQSGTPPAPGTTGGFGWRVTATFTLQRVRVHLYLDLLGFVYGPARVTLFSSGALRPFPAAVQQRLFSLLLDRAKARGV